MKRSVTRKGLVNLFGIGISSTLALLGGLERPKGEKSAV